MLLSLGQKREFQSLFQYEMQFLTAVRQQTR